MALNVEELKVRQHWKEKFKLIDDAGGTFSAAQKNKITRFNTLAFFVALLFGPVYYFYKHMWKKGLVFFGFNSIMTAVFSNIGNFFGLNLYSIIYTMPTALLLAFMANFDYYRQVVHKEKMWKTLPFFDRYLFIIIFVLISIYLTFDTSFYSDITNQFESVNQLLSNYNIRY